MVVEQHRDVRVGTTSVPPSGSVSFTLYSDSACTVSTGVSGAGGISTTTGGVSGAAFSMGWVAPATGTYYWRATYAGDVSNNGFTTPCGGPGELIVVGPGSPFITTQASPTSITVGTPTTVGDTATFENTTSVPPTGSVTFTLYSNDTCTTPAGVSGSAPISTDTSGETTAAFSTTWTAPATGDYYWRASYAGDANNNAFTAGCNDANELIVVGPGSPSITTQASPMSMLVNTTLLVGDTATFQNTTSVAPTGSVSFTLYSDPTCTTSTGVSGSAMVLTSGGASTASFAAMWTAPATGTFYWRASYAGDGNNNAFTTACGDLNESIVVSAPANGWRQLPDPGDTRDDT